MAEITVLGGGVAGISAAWHANKIGRDATIFEAKDRWGGLLDHFQLEGFRFDNAVHFAFSSNDQYRAILELTDYITHEPAPYNYDNGRWLKHPVQNNLYPLDAREKVSAIKSFIERPAVTRDPNYRKWLDQQFGKWIAERYPARYTEKYWTIPADKMGTEWIGNRLYRPSIDEVLLGAMSDDTPQTYYLPEMLYPKKGGYRTFLEPLVQDLDLRLNKEVERINIKNKFILFKDGTREYYSHLVSSLPLPRIIEMMDDIPLAVKEAADSLWATSVGLVSLGFNKPEAGDYLWFYIYDQDILPSRCHAPYRKSPDNVPDGCSSLQFEIYYSRHKSLKMGGEELIDHVISQVERLKLARKTEVVVADYRTLPFGNVVFDLGMVKRRNFVLEHIKRNNILPVGRFGEWDYLWADQSFLSGKKVEALPFMV